MRYLKVVGAMALAVAAMAVGAGGAAASTLTQDPVVTGTVKAEGSINMDGAVGFACESTLEWGVEEHGAGVPISGNLTGLTFNKCGPDTVTVLTSGRFKLHATSSGNGTMTWNGAQITVQLHRSIFGFPITTHCIYATNNTDIGTFTGSATTKETARLDIGFQIPQVETEVACGEIAELTGSYEFTSPDYLVVD